MGSRCASASASPLWQFVPDRWGHGIPALPVGLTLRELDLKFTYADLKPVEGAPYVVLFDDGTQVQGTLDAQGEATIENPPGPGRVFFGYDARDAFPYPERPVNPIFGFQPTSPEDAEQALEQYAQAEAAFMEDNYFPDEVAAIYSGDLDFQDLTEQYGYHEEAEPDEQDDGEEGSHEEVLITGAGPDAEASA